MKRFGPFGSPGFDLGLWAAIVVIIICGCLGMTMSVRQSTAFWNDCEDAGGHVVDTHGKGNSRICVSEDGRIIEIPLRY